MRWTLRCVGDRAAGRNSLLARIRSPLPVTVYVDHSVAAATLRQLPKLRCRLPARLPIATCSMSPIPSAPLYLLPPAGLGYPSRLYRPFR